jgi:multiple sugar transport system ATP-binding protein
VGRELLAGIRGENVVVDRVKTPGSIPGQTIVVEPLGSQLLVNLTVSGHTLKVLTAADFDVSDGAVLWLRPIPEKIRWYDPDTLLQIPV